MMPGTIRRGLLAAVLTALPLLAATAAQAATTPPPAVTAQAIAADAAFLAYAPPPTGGAAALCLVDNGVHANPDTQPGLISATAIDGGSGDDVSPSGHGTLMAMTAGASGHAILGIWPQIKIASVRAVDPPTSPGVDPTFEFQYYTQGIKQCLNSPASSRIRAIELALSSTIPGSPDQTADFASALAAAHGQNAAVVAAAGNQPGAVEEPASEPGVLAVGAGTAQPNTLSLTNLGAPCGFSASQGLSLYAPGCGLDQADPLTDTYTPDVLGNGTSQASTIAAAVIVALESYDPALTYAKAEQLLVSTTHQGNLDAAAAFRADGLGAVVDAGTAAIPKPPPAPTPPAAPAAPAAPAPPAAAAHPGLAVRSLTWRHGTLTLSVTGLPTADRMHVELDYAHHRPRRVVTSRATLRIHTGRPRQVLLRVFAGRSEVGSVLTAHVK
jgi:hypothetical protein